MDKGIFIYNPMSGQRSVPGKLDFIVGKFMKSNILLQPFRIFGYNQINLLETLNSDKYSFAIISGGDGTVNMVINTLLKNKIDIPIGIIPSGTCNDFARSLNMPVSIDKSLDVILSGKTMEIDTGLLNEELYFLNTCAGGIFANVSFNTSNELKKNFGSLAYYLKAVSEMAAIKPFHLKLNADEAILEGEALLFLVLNGKHVGGFSNVAAKADITDGLMDIVIIKNCLHIDMAGLLFKVLHNELLNDRNVISLRAKQCYIEGNNIPISIDGEKGPDLPISIRFIKKNLKVFVK